MSRRVVPALLLAGTVLGGEVLRASMFEPSPIEQAGRDRFTRVRGGCEVGPTGASDPDRYLDAGEIVQYDVSFRSMTDASNVTVALRAVRADADSPASCAPGSLDCSDPDRVNNPLATELSILGSPVVLASVPAGVPQTVSFTIHVADEVLGTPKTELLVDVTSGATHEILVARTSLDVDEQSVYYSTDFPLGGVQDRDLNGDGTIENPIVGGPFHGRYETTVWSDLTAGGTLNAGLNSPWNFDITGGGFVSGISATTDPDQFTDVIAQWGEDTNFNGADNRRCQNAPEIGCVRDQFCPGSIHMSCQSIEQRDPPDTVLNRSWNIRGGCGHQTKAPGRCSILTTLGCYTSADCPQGTGTCVENPTGVGGVWHTGRIGGTTDPVCLGSGSGNRCQAYETISGAGDLRWFELLLTPVVAKVHTGTDADGDPTHAAEIRNFAWNLSLDLSDGYATFTWELDNRNDIVRGVCDNWTYSCSTDADCPPGPCVNGFCGWGFPPLPECSTHADCLPATGTCTALVSAALTGDDAVLGSITGPFGAVTGGDPAALGGYPMFAPIDAGGSSSNISREGQAGCFFEGPGVSSPPYLLAGPPDGTPFVTKNGPIRNMDITRLGGPDLAFELLEDRIGDTGTAFRGAFGFEVTQKALPGDPDPRPGFGAAVDDVVLEWREYTLVEDAAGCGPGEPTILAVGKDGEDVLIDYASGCASASHNVEYGPLASVSTYGYSGHDCGIGDGGSYRFQPGPGSFFWIVVPTDDDSIEGSTAATRPARSDRRIPPTGSARSRSSSPTDATSRSWTPPIRTSTTTARTI